MPLALALWVLVAAAGEGLSAPVLVSAEGAPLAAPVAVRAEAAFAAAPVAARAPVLGAAFDVGAPDGAALTVLFFPRSWVQLGAGALTHLGGAGFRLSLAVVPFSGPVRPLLAVDYGHYFPGDFRWVLSADAPSGVRSALAGVQYDFVNGHLGLELGGGRVSFAIRAGVSYLAGRLGAFQQGSEAGSVSGAAPRVSMVMPSGKLGLTWSLF